MRTKRLLLLLALGWLTLPSSVWAFYNPTTGRWFSRDPVEEQGGLNIYGFVDNGPVGGIDVLGRWNEKVHYVKTIEWSGAAGFGPTYAGIIGESDIGTDSIAGGHAWLPRPFGEQERHLNHPSFAGGDSRDYWYNTEFATAVGLLKTADKEQNRIRCVEAAQHFGLGLHSRQDKSAHRNWPTGGDWSGWIAHPAWWDDWYDEENAGVPVSDNFWRRYNRQPDYYVWVGSSAQQASQNAARQRVITDSQQAISAFVAAVRKTCICRKEMLLSP